MHIALPLDPDAIATSGAVHRIAPAVWRIVAPNPGPLTGPGTNTYVVGARTPLVIDPGPDDPEHLERILAVCPRPPLRILCTHSHPDHSPGAAPLAAVTGAPVCGRPAPDDGHQDASYAPSVLLSDGEGFEVDDDRLQVLHTPGHASNHLCFLLASAGLLFTGDHLMSGSTVVIIPPDGSMREYLDSLARLATLPLRAIAPGHGSRMPDALGEIERVRRHRLAREARVVEVLRELGRASLEQLLPVVYADVSPALHPVARYSLRAHLIKLVDEGSAALDDDQYRWLRA